MPINATPKAPQTIECRLERVPRTTIFAITSEALKKSILTLLSCENVTSKTVKDVKERLFRLIYPDGKTVLASSITVEMDEEMQTLYLRGAKVLISSPSASETLVGMDTHPDGPLPMPPEVQDAATPPPPPVVPQKNLEQIKSEAQREQSVRLAINTQVQLKNPSAMFLARILINAMQCAKVGPKDELTPELLTKFFQYRLRIPIVTEMLEQAFIGEGPLHLFAKNIDVMCESVFRDADACRSWLESHKAKRLALLEEQKRNEEEKPMTVVSGKADLTAQQTLALLESGKSSDIEKGVRETQQLLVPRRITHIAKTGAELSAFEGIERLLAITASPAAYAATGSTGDKLQIQRLNTALQRLCGSDSEKTKFVSAVTGALNKIRKNSGDDKHSQPLTNQVRAREFKQQQKIQDQQKNDGKKPENA